MSPQTLSLALPTGTWNVDASHTRIGFVARHMMVTKVRGEFREYTADVQVAENPFDSKVAVEVAMASIDTGNADRDGHLRTNDFFAVDEYPTMTFVSTRFASKGDSFVMEGDLTLRGVTKPVEFEVEFEGVGADPWGGTRAGFTASAVIDRTDWGVEFNAALETGGVLVSNKVTIELDIQLVQA